MHRRDFHKLTTFDFLQLAGDTGKAPLRLEKQLRELCNLHDSEGKADHYELVIMHEKNEPYLQLVGVFNDTD